ncbi:Trm112p-domain-containing protein [Fragilariopsis cylindrus CCMP1102]|jgi:multifunctional methyltransferase subunit TRM112|uniref:Trm112p-domain-containing protein n=1 Tax=Fragilariopsis cylindrus CCMP1102 TaxID=635003 RepID=A0A1E7FGU3_9STRA|nr:Trm112p-domain-containing protein [Fragilariopsis cylindrus CCMP1102]|eukprot:OEU17401.1 Trm112p-domain-containing protein [Fragilariopsis cylindrus CCMP1102]
MRLLTHNTMRNNSKEAKGMGFPFKITAAEVKVIDNPDAGATEERDIDFVKRMLPILEWTALVRAASECGISSLPHTLTTDLAESRPFLQALYHILMNVHLIKGMLTCPVTGREFPVTNGVPNMMLEEDECERVRL